MMTMQRRSVLHNDDHGTAAATATTTTTTTMKQRSSPPPPPLHPLQRKNSNSKELPSSTNRQQQRRLRRRKKRASSFSAASLFKLPISIQEEVVAEWLQTGFTFLLILLLLCLIVLVVFLLSTLVGAPKNMNNKNIKNNNNNNGLIHELKNGDTVQDLQPLPWNPIYKPADSMEIVGDRSNHYARLRQEIDPLLTTEVIQEQLAKVMTAANHKQQQGFQYAFQSMEMHHSDQVPYDIYNCPDHPPAGYPFTWKTIDILRNWPADQTTPPTTTGTANHDDSDETKHHGHTTKTAMIYHSLCIFDYRTDYDKAIIYREAMKPFIVVNDPQVQETVARWSLPNYMDRLLGTVPHRTEYSENNHFMYYVPQPKNIRTRGRRRRNADKIPEGWTAPTKAMRMPYYEWLRHANVTDEHATPNSEHWYFRLIGCGTTGNDGSCDNGSSEYLFDELPFFQPKPSLYVVEPDMQKGIHCRFGMKGVIAENHFDSSRNAIVLLSGSRRYILAHPDQCENMALYEKGHPSARHSAVDWSHPDLEEYPQFANALSNEVVLQPGQVLYLPTNWFHFIVSLELNMQCNTRSGIEPELMTYVRECGF